MSEGTRVLVCDDELQILRALKVVLREAGFEVTAVATAAEALDQASVDAPDAAIIDLAAHSVSRDGAEVHLTPTEFELLRTLARNRGAADDAPDPSGRRLGPGME